MKKIPVIVLVTLLLLDSVGYYFSFFVREFSAETEAWNWIKDNGEAGKQGVELSFPFVNGAIAADGLVFKNKNEFTYKGRMYDIISRCNKGTQVIFNCYSDNDETESLNDLCLNIEKEYKEPVSQNKSGLFIKNLFKDYVPLSFKGFVFSPLISSAFNLNTALKENTDFTPGVLSPPPQS